MNKQNRNTVRRGHVPSSKFYFTDISDEDAKIMSKIKSLLQGLSQDGLEKLVNVGSEILTEREATITRKIPDSLYAPVSFSRDIEFGSWNVLVKRNIDNRKFWVDIWLDLDYHDILSDWNQYIFISTDSEDLARKNIQDDTNEFLEATSTAIQYLEDIEEIYQNEGGDWFASATVDNWKTTEKLK